MTNLKLTEDNLDLAKQVKQLTVYNEQLKEHLTFRDNDITALQT